MSANSRFSIAVHTLAVLGYLQDHGATFVSSQQIAKSVNTNPVVIRNLLRALKKAGLVKSKEGKIGGVRLIKSPEKISLQEVYAAVEETGIFGMNRNPEYPDCPVSTCMKRILPSLFDEVDRAVARTLAGKKLSEIIEKISG